MDLQLKDKVVLVTGGAKGIGAAIVRAVSREGSIPVVVDNDAEAGGALRAELQAGGAIGDLCVLDLCSAENCAKAVEAAVRAFGVDALVNNAGVNDKVGLEHGSPNNMSVLRAQSSSLLQYGITPCRI
jgi:L-fucose dehydrogenase